MITEDYVSFEIAKLLKEKGFDWDCQYCYIDEDDSDKEQLEVPTGYDAEIDAPTLQMAMKWLRERHKIHIAVEITDCFDYYWICYVLHTSKSIACDPDEGDYFKTYEEACEDAIKYYLENMVK